MTFHAQEPAPDSDADGSPGFPILTEGQLARLRHYGVPEDIAVGDLLYSRGESVRDLVVVDTGTVDIVATTADSSEEVQITQHGPGRFLGELNLLTGQFTTLTARVTAAGHIHRIPPDRFRRLMAEDGELSDILLTAFQARRELVKSRASRGIEILGAGSSAGSLALRTYASRLQLPHLWFEADSVAGLALMKTAQVELQELPVVFLPGGRLKRCTPGELAERLGLSYRKHEGRDDLTVIGGGPAGLAAAVYGASEGLTTILLDAVSPGGQAAASSRIENYLGFPNGISGEELTRRAAVQALKFGVELFSPCEVTALEIVNGLPQVILSDGSDIQTGAVIVATGARYRGLPLDHWSDLEGAGIYYAATKIEADACLDRPVTVIGGANSAGQAALFLAAHNCAVNLVVRANDVGKAMSAYLVERLVAHPLIRVITGSEVTALSGIEQLESVSITDTATGQTIDADCVGLFCFIGATPATSWLTGVDVDENGFIRTDVSLAAGPSGLENTARTPPPLPFETNIPGVFAAGDVRLGSMKRVAAAVGEGASAVASVHQAIAARL